MDAPLCIVCSTKHWSRMPCPVMRTDKRERLERAGYVVGEDFLGRVTNVTNVVTNSSRSRSRPAGGQQTPAVGLSARTDSDRAREWNQANRERYNERQREYMRKKRAKP